MPIVVIPALSLNIGTSSPNTIIFLNESSTFNNEALNVDIRTYTYNSPLNANKSFTLSANDGSKSFNKSIVVLL